VLSSVVEPPMIDENVQLVGSRPGLSLPVVKLYDVGDEPAGSCTVTSVFPMKPVSTHFELSSLSNRRPSFVLASPWRLVV
jgi:hypothetical protein